MKNVVSKLTAKLSRRLALAAGCAFALVSSLSAANYYIAQSALGAGDGSTAANAAPYTFFNAAGNWSSTAGAAGKISPGSTVHLVGTLTSQLNVQGSGAAGNVITVLFEPNAVMTSPAWPQSGAINVVQDNYITIDGGSNGIIQNTANGTNLALQQDSCGVNAPDCHFFTVQNLTVANIYVHVAGADTNSYGSAIQDYGEDTGLVTDFKVTNCKIHDACNAIYCDYGSPGCANYTFSFNTIYNCNWGIGCGDRNSSAVLTNVQVYNNLIYNFSNWDDNNDQNHHNGVYIFAENGGTMKSASIYNNTIGPAFGVHATSAIFFSGASFVGPVLIYNNLFLDNLNDNPDDGFITALPGPGSVFRIYNNDFIGGGVGNALDLGSQHGGTQTFDVRNNIDNGTATFIYVEYGTSVKLTADYNDGYNLASGSQYAYSNDNSGAFDSFAQWQAMGYDLHGTSGNANLNNIFIPQPVSAVIKTGTTMAGDGVTPLSSFFTTDKSGATRPQGSAWDMGAFEYASGSPVLTTQPISQSVTTAGTATFTVAATGTPAPTFEWMKGTVNLTNGGNISGATTAVLTVSSVSASDAATYSAVASNSAGFAISNGAVLTVAGKAPAITSAVAASATSGSSFIYAITATNSPTSFNATGLPSGLSVNTSTGAINGTPTTAGTSVIAISAVNAGGAGTASLNLTVSGPVLPAPVVTSATSATAKAGSAFSYAISASNSPTSFSATGLPSGLSVNTSTGVISGTPASAGTFSATISARNASGTGSASLTLSINNSVITAPVVTNATSATATVGSAFSFMVTGTNSPTSYGASGLPAGLSLNAASGKISGTPTATGTFAVAVSAKNASGTGSATLTVTVGGVSSAAISVKNAWLGASGSASNAAVAVAPTAGNLVVVAISGYQGSYANHAVTDNKGSVYTRVIGANISTTDLTGSIWYLANAPAGITSIVGSSGSSSLSTTVIVHEVAGATSFTAGEAAATSALGTTNPQTPSITNGTPKSVSFALCANSSGSNPAPISINGSGTIGTWSLLSSTASQETNGGSYIATSVPYLIENSSQAEKQGWTTGTDAYGEHNLVMIAAFH